MAVLIRRARAEDIPQIYAISCAVHQLPLYGTLIPNTHLERFRSRYTPSPEGYARYKERMLARLTDPAWYVWVATVDDVVAGFTLAHLSDDRLWLKGLFVSENFQGQRIGRELFRESLSLAGGRTPIELEVLKGNDRAVEMYVRAGFRMAGETDKPFYGASMIRMEKH